MQKVQKVYDKLNQEIKPILNKIREMIEAGELTPDMIDFEYYSEEEIITSLKVVYHEQPDTNIEKKYLVEIQVSVRDR